MLRTIQGKKLFMITQPDHAEVAGYLAAHWGNEEFALPGYFASSRDPERLRAETVFAIATHDNGWWEWEATPEISDIDGLPLNLSDVLKNQAEGMNRWHLAIPRFSKDHPYASLLISFHAYWLYAHSYETDSNPAFIHPLFWKGSQLFHHNDEELKNAQKFVSEIKDIQNDIFSRLRKDTDCVDWIEPENLYPNARLLQLLDGLSLYICSNLIRPSKGEAKGLGEDEFDLLEVPRKNWEDRVKINIEPLGETRIACYPYPFDTDPLSVIVPAKVFDLPLIQFPHFQTGWNSQQIQHIQFEFCSSNN